MNRHATTIGLIVTNVLAIVAAELLLKTGASTANATSNTLFNFGAVSHAATWLGVAFYITAFLSWLLLLRFMPLSRAYALVSVSQAIVPLGAWFFLGEAISGLRMAGVSLVLIGCILVAAQSEIAEQRL